MLRSITRAMIALACASTVAHAQLGGFLKKAKDKAESKVEKKAQPEEASPPLAGDPLTSGTLDAVLKGLAIEVKQQGEAATVRRAWQQKQDEWRSAFDASRAEDRAYRSANEKQMSCMNDEMDAANRKYDAAMEAKAASLGTDRQSQEFLKKYTDLSMRIAAALQKNDTAAMARLKPQVPRLLGMDPAKDSLAAYQKCGRPTTPPASVVRANKLRKEMDDLADNLRGIEGKLAERAAAAAGMPVDKYSTARERLYTWNTERQENEGKRSVTKDEDALFKSRLDDIKKIESALR